MDTSNPGRQQHSSAQHYLSNPTSDTSLTTAVALAAKYFAVPMVQVNVLDADTQVTVAAFGLPVGTVPRAESLCNHVVRKGKISTLADIGSPPASADRIKAYIGVPLTCLRTK